MVKGFYATTKPLKPQGAEQLIVTLIVDCSQILRLIHWYRASPLLLYGWIEQTVIRSYKPGELNIIQCFWKPLKVMTVDE